MAALQVIIGLLRGYLSIQAMDKIQLIFFFVSGFLVSRLIIKVKLPQRMVYWFVGKRRLSLSKILLFLMAISAFLSFFIPNAITVLTLLPVLELLRRSYESTGGKIRSIATMLALSTIYGANIGGMGSVTGTPANGIMVTYSVINNVPGTQHLSFASWLFWGVPLVILFVGIAWLILIGTFRAWHYKEQQIDLPFKPDELNHPFQTITIWITVLYFISACILSLLMMNAYVLRAHILISTGIITLLFVMFLFFVPIKDKNRIKNKVVLLKFQDCFTELPTKGFLFVGIAVILAAILYTLNMHEFISEWVERILPTKVSPFALFLVIALATSFSTEVLSNTAVQLSFFVLALPLANTLGVSSLELLIIITLSCTSAFMSPIATGVNGLAFGGVKGVSFVRMLLVGCLVNFAGALLISSWVLFVVGKLYGLD